MNDNRVNRLVVVTASTVRAILLVALTLAFASHPGTAAASVFGPAPSPVPFIQSISPM